MTHPDLRDDRRDLIREIFWLWPRSIAAGGLRKLADLIEAPDPYLPTQSQSAHRRQHAGTTGSAD